MIDNHHSSAVLLALLICTVPLTGCVDDAGGPSRYMKIYVENNDREDAEFRIQIAGHASFDASLPATAESPNVGIAGEVNLTEEMVSLDVEETNRDLHERRDVELFEKTYVIVRLESNDTLSILTSSSEPLFD